MWLLLQKHRERGQGTFSRGNTYLNISAIKRGHLFERGTHVSISSNLRMVVCVCCLTVTWNSLLSWSSHDKLGLPMVDLGLVCGGLVSSKVSNI